MKTKFNKDRFLFVCSWVIIIIFFFSLFVITSREYKIDCLKGYAEDYCESINQNLYEKPKGRGFYIWCWNESERSIEANRYPFSYYEREDCKRTLKQMFGIKYELKWIPIGVD